MADALTAELDNNPQASTSTAASSTPQQHETVEENDPFAGSGSPAASPSAVDSDFDQFLDLGSDKNVESLFSNIIEPPETVFPTVDPSAYGNVPRASSFNGWPRG